MASLTNHYQLQELSAGDPFSTNGQKYTTSDRAEIDRLLYVGAEGHHHNGDGISQADPALAGSTSVSTTGGTISSGLNVYYKYTWVDVNGFETAASPQCYAVMPSQVSAPNGPAVSPSTASGSLEPGSYYYLLTAYTSSSTYETTVSAPGYALLTAEGQNTILFPSLPSGASGFNIYAKYPNGTNYLYLTSVAVSGSTPATSYTDNGGTAVNCNRYAPTSNNTSSANSVTFTLPTSVPSGFTWNLYRTTTSGSWTNSLLASNANDVTTYTDTGAGTGTGSPPTSTELISSPSQIDLTSEVQGVLPYANFGSLPFVVTFDFSGTVTVQNLAKIWVSEFTSAKIVGARAYLGRGSVPASQEVIVDVVALQGATPTYSSIYGGATPTKPFIPIGQSIGAFEPAEFELFAGDSFSVNVTQAGGGATPTDNNLRVNVYILVTEP
jgi:hypothetical protein